MDHLHLRGEKFVVIVLAIIAVGSPPLTWRKALIAARVSVKVRITSTYVEKSREKMDKLTTDEDHLHLRGEKTKKIPLYQAFIIKHL